MPKNICLTHLVGQPKIAHELTVAFNTGNLGHAYLLSGSIGTGTFQAALSVGMALLCENHDVQPCFECTACRKVLQYNHPDFHCVFSLHLSKEHTSSSDTSKLTEQGWEYVAAQTRCKIANPYRETDTRSFAIPIDWIRDLNSAIVRGSILGGMNVAILCDIEILSAGSANTLLKTIEEPPENTIILLLTQRLHSVLPTIKSRCQIIRFGNCSSQSIVIALQNKISKPSDDELLLLASIYAEGSFGKALDFIEKPVNTELTSAAEFMHFLYGKPQWFSLMMKLEKLVESNSTEESSVEIERLVRSFLHIARLVMLKNSMTAIPIPQQIATCVSIPALKQHTIDQFRGIASACDAAIRAIKVRANVLLTMTIFSASIMEIAYGKE